MEIDKFDKKAFAKNILFRRDTERSEELIKNAEKYRSTAKKAFWIDRLGSIGTITTGSLAIIASISQNEELRQQMSSYLPIFFIMLIAGVEITRNASARLEDEIEFANQDFIWDIKELDLVDDFTIYREYTHELMLAMRTEKGSPTS